MWLRKLLPCANPSATPSSKENDAELAGPANQSREVNAFVQLIRSLSHAQQGSQLEQLQSTVQAARIHLKLAFLCVYGLSESASLLTPLAASGSHSDSCPVGIPQPLSSDGKAATHLVILNKAPVSVADSSRCSPSRPLPSDWAPLAAVGVRSFGATPICVAGRVVGVLTMGHLQPGFVSSMMEMQSELLASWMSHLFLSHDGLLGAYCGFLEELMQACTVDELIKSICSSVLRLHTGRTYHARLQCRLAVIGRDCEKAVIFDTHPVSPKLMRRTSRAGASRRPSTVIVGGLRSRRTSSGGFQQRTSNTRGSNQRHSNPRRSPHLMLASSVVSVAHVSARHSTWVSVPDMSCNTNIGPTVVSPPGLENQASAVESRLESRGQVSRVSSLRATVVSEESVYIAQDAGGGGGLPLPSARPSPSGRGPSVQVSLGQFEPRSLRTTPQGKRRSTELLRRRSNETGARSRGERRSSRRLVPNRASQLAEEGRCRERDSVGTAVSASGFSISGVNFSYKQSLLSQVVEKQDGAWIVDCMEYLQKPHNPSADVVLAAMADRLGSSMVVDVMYAHDRRPLLAVYLATDSTCSPAALQSMIASLSELLHVLSPLVEMKLYGELAEEWTHMQVDVLGVRKPTIDAARLERDASTAAALADVASVPRSHASWTSVTGLPMPPTLDPTATTTPTAGAVTAAGRRQPAAQPPQGSRLNSSLAPRVPAAPSTPNLDLPPAAEEMVVPRAESRSLHKWPFLSFVGRSHSSQAITGRPSPPPSAEASDNGGSGPRTLSGQVLHSNRSFTVERSNSSLRLGLLVSGLQDRVQTAQRRKTSSTALHNRPEDLQALEVLDTISSGGFGVVYHGQYQGGDVAIKVIPEPGEELEASVFRNAVELAMLTTLSHPNVVQVLTFFTEVTVTPIPAADLSSNVSLPPVTLKQSVTLEDESFPRERSTPQVSVFGGWPGDVATMPMPVANIPPPIPLALMTLPLPAHVVTPQTPAAAAAAAPQLTATAAAAAAAVQNAPAAVASLAAMQDSMMGEFSRPLTPSSEAMHAGVSRWRQPPFKALVIVMEYCDSGTLKDAIRSDAFKGGSTMQPLMPAIYQTLLEVALALRYLHSLRLVHRDIKPANILLKSAAGDHREFTTKLSDFGLAKVLREDGGFDSLLRDHKYSGTITHVAPEALRASGGHALIGTPADIYAFGILMYEILTGEPVHAALTSEEVLRGVLHYNLRPKFPPHHPPVYTSLAERCWSADPTKRPTADQLAKVFMQLAQGGRPPKRRGLSAVTRRCHSFSAMRREQQDAFVVNLHHEGLAGAAAGGGSSGAVLRPVGYRAPVVGGGGEGHASNGQGAGGGSSGAVLRPIGYRAPVGEGHASNGQGGAETPRLRAVFGGEGAGGGGGGGLGRSADKAASGDVRPPVRRSGLAP